MTNHFATFSDSIISKSRQADSMTLCLARLWAWQSGFSRNLGHLGLARKLQSQGLDLLGALERAGGDTRREQAFLLWRAATAQLSNRREARLLAEQSVALYRAVGARWEMAGVLRELGEHLQALGFYDEAARVQHEVLAIYRELGDPRGIAGSLTLVGWVLFEQGDPAEAERLTREALVLQRALNDTPDLVQLSIIVQLQGRFAEARSLAEDALAGAAESWGRLGLPGYISTLSDCELHLGQYGEARLRYQAGLVLARDVGHTFAVGLSLLGVGCAAMAEGALAEARQLCQESLAIYDGMGDWAQAIVAHAAVAEVALLQGNLGEAQEHLGTALCMLTEHRSFIALLVAQPFVARLLAEQGQAERAVEMYALASRYPYVANSRWYEDLVGQRIAAVAATLPPEVVAAAQERGRARDPWATAEELAAELAGG